MPASPPLSPTRARALLIASLVVLTLVVAAVMAWPDPEARADLVTVTPPTTATVPETTTTAPTTAVPHAPAPAPVAAPPLTEPAPPPPAPPATGPVDPVRLRIPSIGVDVAVVSVALSPDGQMEIPPAREAGWYRLGPQPGAPGSAVLAAHIDYGGEPGAFFDLPRLGEGEEVVVVGPDGAEHRFVVTRREQVAKAEVQLEHYFTAEGETRLTLITCGGAFDGGVGHYEDNIIVTAVPA